MNPADAIDAALERRAGLPLEALRLIDGRGDELPRFTLERYGDAVRASGGPEQAPLLPLLRARFETLFWRFGHGEQGGPPEAERVVHEAGLRFDVRLRGHRNTGIFLDGRPARAWVRAHSEGRRVLNLFAYTCGFGMAAAAGGARSTTNVDAVPSVLARGRANYENNGLSFDTRSFWRSDVFEALRRAKRSGARFEGIILDPPPQPSGGGRGKRVDLARHLGPLCRRARELLTDDGWLLVLCARRSLTDDELVTLADAGEPTWRGSSGADFTAQPKLRAFAFQPASAPQGS